jgi:hypothetical protein
MTDSTTPMMISTNPTGDLCTTQTPDENQSPRNYSLGRAKDSHPGNGNRSLRAQRMLGFTSAA